MLDFVAIDLETTGLYPLRGDRVIEIGAVRVRDGSIQSEFSSLVNCGKVISNKIQKITGISNEMLKNQPCPKTAFSEFRLFLRDSVIVAHNAKFDRSFLRREFGLLGWGLKNRFCCSLQRSRELRLPVSNFGLDAVSDYFLNGGHETTRLHRALPDARLTARIWLELMKERFTTDANLYKAGS